VATVEIAEALTRAGASALVATEGGRLATAVKSAGGEVVELPLASKNPITMLSNARRLAGLVEARGVDLVHARSRAPAWSAFFAARRTRRPFVTTFHGAYSGRFLPKRFYNSIMARGDRVIAISDYVAHHVGERYGVAPDRLRVIHRGIDAEAFAADRIAPDRVNDLAKRWQVAGDAKIVMLPGRVTRIKGHLQLLQAIEQMARRNFTCLVVGNLNRKSGYVREIERQIGARGLARIVRLVGGCHDMPAALALADVVVLPAIGPEGFGRVSVEAQALGKPVVASDIGGLGETLMPAATGWLVPPDRADELARALELALALPDDVRARLATRARRFVLRRFTAERMATRTLAVYRELLDGPTGAPQIKDLAVAA
jgi:glycosyltransferase involved in cell wall biosynthesis